MASKRILKVVHAVSTAWFILCAAYLLTTALRQAGTAWWVIFSLGGYSAVITFFLLSIYLVAIYRGVRRSSIKAEYPLTSSLYYMAFYDVCPFVGAMAGLLSAWGASGTVSMVNMISIGSLATTFFVWIVIDPTVGYVEMILPSSRALRHQRIAAAKAEQNRLKQHTRQILDQVTERELSTRQKWQPVLEPLAKTLAVLMDSPYTDYRQKQLAVVEMGSAAWRLGGIECMRRLREMAVANHKCSTTRLSPDYISAWWDGIGTWRIQGPSIRMV